MESVEEKMTWELCRRVELKQDQTLGIVRHLAGAQSAVTQTDLPLSGAGKAVSSLKDSSLLFSGPYPSLYIPSLQ